MAATDERGNGAGGPSNGPSLGEWIDRQYEISAAKMLQSVSAVHLVKERPGFGQTIRPNKGSVLASPTIASYDPDPDYFFHWLRDSAIVIDAVAFLIEDGSCGAEAVEAVKDFVRFSLALGDLDGRDLLRSGAAPAARDPAFEKYMRPASELKAAVGEDLLGETRFNPDGTLDATKWARPQHDGPALRALACLRLWRLGVFDDDATREAARRLIETDLAFTLRVWRRPSYDIWEEEIGHPYYTRLVQHAALAYSAQWFDERSEAQRAENYRAACREILGSLDDYWSAADGFYRSRIGVAGGSADKQLDISVILAVIHAGRKTGPHSALDPKAQATLSRLEALFTADYSINRSLPPGRGAAMGRYRGDVYYSGGAYYFATLAAAEFLFRQAQGSVSGGAGEPLPSISLSGSKSPTLEKSLIAKALIRRGDAFLATVRAFTPVDGELSEQFDRQTGEQTSSKNLAWSHAALVMAVRARREACAAVAKA
jgi:glucoamylase